jgi:hypothetical protein
MRAIGRATIANGSRISVEQLLQLSRISGRSTFQRLRRMGRRRHANLVEVALDTQKALNQSLCGIGCVAESTM